MNQPFDFYEKHFASIRMKEYLLHFEGDQELAKRLYIWNNAISAAFWELISFVEVSLRNVLSGSLEQRQSRLNPQREWVFDSASRLFEENPRMATSIEQACLRIEKNKKEITSQQVISELTFGFWCQLLAKQNSYLRPDFASSFGGLSTRNLEIVAKRVFEIRDLRNRIGHHHRIYNLDLVQKHENLLRLATYIDPDFGVWLAGKSRVAELLALHPHRVSA